MNPVTSDQQIAAPLLPALLRTARSLGLTVDQPQVLRVGANVVVHLAPSPVVARVATLTAEMRNGAFGYLRREREVSQALAALGLNVVTTTDLVDPGPHAIENTDSEHAVLFLEHRSLQPIDLTSQAHAVAAARSLVDIIEALAGLPPQLSHDDQGQPWEELNRLTEAVADHHEQATMDRLGAVIQQLRDSEPAEPWQLVHGDAHKGNVALDRGQVVWFDFEDANRRPMAWDLASIHRAWPAAGREACRLLQVDPRSPSMRWHHELREVYALLWALLYDQRLRRPRPETDERLAQWLAAEQE